MTWQQKYVFWLLCCWLGTPNDWPNFHERLLISDKREINPSQNYQPYSTHKHVLYSLCTIATSPSFQARKFAPTLFDSYACVTLYTMMQIHKYSAKCLHCSQFSVLPQSCERVPTLQTCKKSGMAALLGVSTFNHKWAHISYLAYSDSLPPNLLKYWANINVQWRGQPWTLKFCQSEQQNSTVSVV